MAKKYGKLVSIRMTCPKNSKNYTAKADMVSANGWQQDCDMCGSHGGVELNVTCGGCGKDHTIELSDW